MTCPNTVGGLFVIDAEAWNKRGAATWQWDGAVTFAELFDEFEDPLHRYAMSLVRNRDWADDLVQETFIRAWSHLPLLGVLSLPQRRAWLRRVLKNVFIDQYRRNVRERALMAALDHDPEDGAVDPSLSLQVHELLEILPASLRDLWYRRYVQGMNAAEIARQLGIPHGTVRSRLHAARRRLRGQVERYL